MRKFITLGATGAGIFLPLAALAQFVPPSVPRVLPGNFINAISGIVGYLVGGIIAVSVIFIIYGAIMFLLSGTNEANLTKAKNILIYSFVAIGVALLASAIVNIAVDLFLPLGGGGRTAPY